ncbi:MAG: radical SAM protein [Cyclobacteriaceae bacterium]
MKIVIINSPLFREENSRYDEDSLPPIGLGYIATSVKNAGIAVELIDAVDQRIPLDRLVELVDTIKPDFLATNIFTTNAQLVREMVEKIDFKTHIVIGGLSTKDIYNEIISWSTGNQIDVVVGDGELIILDILNNRLEEKPVLEMNKRRVFNVFSNSTYYVKDIDKVQLDRSFFKNEPVAHPFGFMEANIVASRGCIFNCTFCAAARSINKEFGIRERSAKSLISEIKDILAEYPHLQSIRVLDDLFLKNSRSIELATLVFSHFDLKWRSMAHVTTFNKVDRAILLKLKQSGCNELFIGIESGSPKILKSINKTHNVKLIIDNLTEVLKAGINIKGYFIYGFPKETSEDMELTFQLASALQRNALKYGAEFRTSVFQYRPYHGTAIYHDLVDQGLYKDSINLEPDDDLSDLIGRLQFNFHTANHSEVDEVIVHDYIYRTTNLTNLEIFSGIKKTARPKKTDFM